MDAQPAIQFSRRGYTVTELVMTLAVIGGLFALFVPFFVTYLGAGAQAAAVKEVRAALNEAKQLAVSTRQDICVVAPGGPTYQLRQGACSGPAWIGSGSDSIGSYRLESALAISIPGGNPVFTPLGTAQTAALVIITPTAGDATTVSVTQAGRIGTP